MKKQLLIIVYLFLLMPVMFSQSVITNYKGMTSGKKIPKWVEYAEAGSSKKLKKALKIPQNEKIIYFVTEGATLEEARIKSNQALVEYMNSDNQQVVEINGVSLTSDYWLEITDEKSKKSRVEYYSVYVWNE